MSGRQEKQARSISWYIFSYKTRLSILGPSGLRFRAFLLPDSGLASGRNRNFLPCCTTLFYLPHRLRHHAAMSRNGRVILQEREVTN